MMKAWQLLSSKKKWTKGAIDLADEIWRRRHWHGPIHGAQIVSPHMLEILRKYSNDQERSKFDDNAYNFQKSDAFSEVRALLKKLDI